MIVREVQRFDESTENYHLTLQFPSALRFMASLSSLLWLSNQQFYYLALINNLVRYFQRQTPKTEKVSSEHNGNLAAGETNISLRSWWKCKQS